MKKLFLVLITAFLAHGLWAQGIHFEENQDLQTALDKAKSENKLVFIDAFAEWCGPCKMMAKDVFPLESVGDFYNAHFINLKLDMEKGVNKEIAKRYEVRAYPTYLFLNSDGELVHKSLGGMSGEKFIEVGRVATDSENNFAAMSRKIEQGDRSLSTIQNFIAQNPYDPSVGSLVEEYFQALPEDQLATQENWDFFFRYVNDINAPSFRYVIEHREAVNQFVGKEIVDKKIYNTLARSYSQNPDDAERLKQVDPEIFAKVKEIGDLSRVYMAFMRNKQSKTAWDDMLAVFTPYLSKSKNATELNTFAWLVYENYKTFNDTKATKNALTWAKTAVDIEPDNDAIVDTYAHLLYVNGKRKQAIKMETKALALATKAGNADRIKEFTEEIQKFKKKK